MATAGEKIKDQVRVADMQTGGIRARQVVDLLRYQQEPFRWSAVSERVPLNTPTMTSNEGYVLARTAMTMLNKARMTYPAPRESNNEQYKQAGRLREQMFAGFLRMADRRQTRLVSPSLRTSAGAMTCLRGFVCGLHVLTKNAKWETEARIEMWDPYNVYWGIDNGGIAWICHYQDLDADRMTARFGPSVLTGYPPQHLRMKDPTWRVWDYYDREENVLMIGERVALRQRHWGTDGYVPATVVPVGPPLMASLHDGFVYSADFGESVYAANRNLYPKWDAALSAKYARLIYALNPAAFEKSRSGRPFIPPETPSAWEMGMRMTLNVADEQEVEALPYPDMPKEATELEGMMSGMLQRGGFSHIVQGQGGQLSSGYNTSLLMGSADFLLEPRMDAIKAWYEAAEESLFRQFVSGYFDGVRMQGMVRRGKTFDMTFEPSELRDAPPLMFEMKVINQAEIVQNLNLAMALRDPGRTGFPLLTDDTIRDRLLDVEDPDLEGALVRMQSARRSTPQALLLQSIKDAIDNEDEMLAKVLEGNLLSLMQPGLPPMLPIGGEQRMMRGAQGGGRGMETNAGGSPRGGMPNVSGPEQLGGRPRPAGTR